MNYETVNVTERCRTVTDGSDSIVECLSGHLSGSLERCADSSRETGRSAEPDDSFDEVVVPHLEAARRLARWLTRNEDDAADVVQEASLRAFRYFRTFVGGDSRAWFLRIVRNICTDRRRDRAAAVTDQFDERHHRSRQPALNPETLLLRNDDSVRMARALRSLPDRFHRLIVLREFNGLSYRELADVTGMPMGTVMSRLSRARAALRSALRERAIAVTDQTTIRAGRF